MSFFRWAAPIFKMGRHRWSEKDFAAYAAHLRPCVPPEGLLLDVGGGTGDLGLGIARALGARVLDVDATAEMLLLVSPDPSITVRLAAAEGLPFPDGHFDGVLCSDALHHFRDRKAAAAEMARVLRPGGCMLMHEFRRRSLGRFLVVVERLLGEPGEFMEPEQLQTLLGALGISGRTTYRGPATYTFVGRKAQPS